MISSLKGRDRTIVRRSKHLILGSELGPVLFILYTQPLFNLVSKHAVNHHAFADDSQLYKISTLDAIHQSTEALRNCTTDVRKQTSTK